MLKLPEFKSEADEATCGTTIATLLRKNSAFADETCPGQGEAAPCKAACGSLPGRRTACIRRWQI